jgi:hypothetical protein
VCESTAFSTCVKCSYFIEEGRRQRAGGRRQNEYCLLPSPATAGSKGLSPPLESLKQLHLFGGGFRPPPNSSLLPSAFCLLPSFQFNYWQLLPRPDRRSLHNIAKVIHNASTTCAVTLLPRVQHLPPAILDFRFWILGIRIK